MGYVERNLIDGERLQARAHLHWIIFARPVAWAVAATALLYYAFSVSGGGKDSGEGTLPMIGGMALFMPAFWTGVGALVDRLTTELAVTSRRVIAKVGFIRRSTVEMNHAKVESIHIEQSVLGRILGYGTLTVVGTGGGIAPIDCIADPLAFRRDAMVAIDVRQ